MPTKRSLIILFLLTFALVACIRQAETPVVVVETAATPTPATEETGPATAVTTSTRFSTVLEEIVADFLLFLPKLLAAMVMFVVTLYLANLISRLVQRLMQRRRADVGITLLIFHVTRWGILILGSIAALRQVEFELTAFLAGLGILGFTVGFALQSISQNLVAGLLLLIQKPFELGETIEVSNYRGRVVSVDLRATELQTSEGNNVLIPNASVFTTPIINYSRQATWRISLPIGVAYDSDLELVQQVTLQAIQALPDVLDEPSPTLFFHTFGDFSINFTVHYWIDGRVTNALTATHPAIIAIHRAYAQAGIEIPYPVQTEIQVEGRK